MADADAEPAAVGIVLDVTWLNDRSEYRRNYVHGLNNPVGLRLQYHLERTAVDADPPAPDPDPLVGHRVVATWNADQDHMGFPGIAHGGLLTAILDDAIGRCAALRHRWVVTGRLDTRFRAPAPVGVPLRVEGWLLRWQRRMISGQARILLPGGTLVAEATGTYLPLTEQLEARMLETWAGFGAYLGREDSG